MIDRQCIIFYYYKDSTKEEALKFVPLTFNQNLAFLCPRLNALYISYFIYKYKVATFEASGPWPPT